MGISRKKRIHAVGINGKEKRIHAVCISRKVENTCCGYK